jgi:CheY-like chemotaxis protein
MIFNHALIVEDDEFTQDLIADFLTDLNIPQISTASNGQDGLQLLLNNNPPDLLLLDINLPILDGYQVIDKLSKHNYQGKIILISGSSLNILPSAQLLARWSNLIVGDYLIKPFDQSSLHASIQSLSSLTI